MKDEWKENIALVFQHMLPFLSAVILLLVSYIPLSFSLFNVKPAMGMICIFFWMVYRPDIFNLGSVFFIGLIDDVVSSAPMGLNVLTALLLYLLINNLQKFLYSKTFAVTWYGFMVLSLMCFIFKWFVASVYYSQFLPISMMLFSYLVTVAFYPFVSIVNAFIQNRFIHDGDL